MAEILNAHASDNIEMLRDDVVLDSGATHHVTNDMSKFIRGTYRKFYGRMIGIANSAIDINGSGSMKLRAQDGQYIMLTDVLYVPKAAYTLVSTGKLVKSGFAVSFTKDDAKVVDKHGQVVLRAVEKEGVPVIVTGTSAGASGRSDVSKKSETIAPSASPRSYQAQRGTASSWSSVVSKASRKVETVKSSTSQRGLQSKTSVNGKSGEHSELRAGRTSPAAAPLSAHQTERKSIDSDGWQVVRHYRKANRKASVQHREQQQRSSARAPGHGHRTYRPIRRGENWELRGHRGELREKNVKQSGDKSARMRSVRAQ
jgi:hypothetical protein